MNKHTVNILKEAAYDVLVAIGAVGPDSRSRTIRSKKDKQKCPKIQRKDKHNLINGE